MMDGMIIGICGPEFPDVREFIARELPAAEIVVFDHGAAAAPRQRVDVLVPLSETVGTEVMDATRPRLIQQFGVGLQGVDAEAARARGIPVRNVPAGVSGNAAAVAEIVLFHLLALLRRVPEAGRSVRRRLVGEPIGDTLDGKIVAVLGTGAIGARVIRLLEAFGAVPLGVGRAATTDLLPSDRYYQAADLDRVLGQARALVVAVPLTAQTRGMVGAAQFAAMPPGGYLVNVGRGPVVDYQALLAALRSGHLAGAGLDVAWAEPVDPDDELFRHNVLVTPHIGGVTTESYAKMAAAFAASIAETLAGNQGTVQGSCS
jgi:phosphoglycerate dehydrogenase-like enzyme